MLSWERFDFPIVLLYNEHNSMSISSIIAFRQAFSKGNTIKDYELTERPRALSESWCMRKVRAPQGKDNG